MELILASSSPRRQQLLRSIGLDFQVMPADVDETVLPEELPIAYVERVAAAKAHVVAGSRPPVAGAAVLAADTTVDVDGTVLAKPVDDDDAGNMLRLLSGRTHRVHTSVFGCTPDGEHSVTITTDVTFVRLSEQGISWYLSMGEHLDKAGAYGMQGAAARSCTGSRAARRTSSASRWRRRSTCYGRAASRSSGAEPDRAGCHDRTMEIDATTWLVTGASAGTGGHTNGCDRDARVVGVARRADLVEAVMAASRDPRRRRPGRRVDGHRDDRSRRGRPRSDRRIGERHRLRGRRRLRRGGSGRCERSRSGSCPPRSNSPPAPAAPAGAWPRSPPERELEGVVNVSSRRLERRASRYVAVVQHRGGTAHSHRVRRTELSGTPIGDHRRARPGPERHGRPGRRASAHRARLPSFPAVAADARGRS